MYFPSGLYNETREVSNWILGKEIGADGVEGYVALRRDDACMDDVNVTTSLIECDEDQQVYALFVGSSDEYMSFDNFEEIVENSQFVMTNDTSILVIDQISVSISEE